MTAPQELPHLERLPGLAEVILADGRTLRLLTPQAARALGDLCRAAEQHLEEEARAAATAQDRRIAEQMNEANRELHAAYGRSIQGWPPEPTRVPEQPTGALAPAALPQVRW